MQHRQGVMRLIAIFKFAKAALLLLVALGSLGLLNPQIGKQSHVWVASLAGGYDNPTLERAAAWVSGLTHREIVELGCAALFFACLFLAEGTGLWLHKRWAEYFTVIATLSLVPLELYELARRVTGPRCLALALNLAVVIYLIYYLRRARRESEQAAN